MIQNEVCKATLQEQAFAHSFNNVAPRCPKTCSENVFQVNKLQGFNCGF